MEKAIESGSHSMSRMKEMNGDAGVTSRSSGNCRTRIPNTIAIAICPASFAFARRPRLRCRDTLR
ncbi:hypothetical protein D3C83_199680 [compost metagenome]